jgi:hypothetical protein
MGRVPVPPSWIRVPPFVDGGNRPAHAGIMQETRFDPDVGYWKQAR